MGGPLHPARNNAVGGQEFRTARKPERVVPIAENRLDQGKRRNRGGIGAQDARTERDPDDLRKLQQGGPLIVGKSALRTDQDRERAGSVGWPVRRERSHGIGDLGILVAKDQEARAFHSGDRLRERDRFADLRQVEDAALFGGFDRVRLHALDIHPRRLGVAGDHRLQARRPHLDRLLYHVVEPGLLERSEQVVQVGRRRLPAGLFLDRELRLFSPLRGEACAPLALAAVERQHGSPVAQAQDVDEIVDLGWIERGAHPRGERRLDKKARSPVVVTGH